MEFRELLELVLRCARQHDGPLCIVDHGADIGHHEQVIAGRRRGYAYSYGVLAFRALTRVNFSVLSDFGREPPPPREKRLDVEELAAVKAGEKRFNQPAVP